jgi:hypothetical protein
MTVKALKNSAISCKVVKALHCVGRMPTGQWPGGFFYFGDQIEGTQRMAQNEEKNEQESYTETTG